MKRAGKVCGDSKELKSHGLLGTQKRCLQIQKNPEIYSDKLFHYMLTLQNCCKYKSYPLSTFKGFDQSINMPLEIYTSNISGEKIH